MIDALLYYGVPALGLLAALVLVYEVARAVVRDWRHATSGSELLRVYDQEAER